MKKVSQTIELTGEVIEFAPVNETELVEAYRLCQETIKTWEAVKKELALLAEPFIGDYGTSEPINGYMFRQTSVQRMNYDKSVMREVLNEDDFDLLLEPNKKAVDDFIKENLEKLGDASTKLRGSMVAAGKPYSVTKLEKVK